VKTSILLLVLTPLAYGQSNVDSFGKGTVTAAEIAAAFNWDAATYAANAPKLTFTYHRGIPFTTKVQIVPPSGAAYTKEGPSVARLSTQDLSGSAGPNGATLTGFSGTEVIQFAEPIVGQSYNPFGAGYSGSYIQVAPGGAGKPSVSVVATIMIPLADGKLGPKAVTIWSK
jgi:hypothetical protein